MVVEIVTIRALGPAHDLPATVNRGRLGGDIARRNTEIDDLAVCPQDSVERKVRRPRLAHNLAGVVDVARHAEVIATRKGAEVYGDAVMPQDGVTRAGFIRPERGPADYPVAVVDAHRAPPGRAC